MTEEELFAIELRVQRCTPGPCEVNRIDEDNGEITYQVQSLFPITTGKVLGTYCDFDNPRAKFDAEFEANSRTDVWALINEIKAQRQLMDNIRRSIPDECNDNCPLEFHKEINLAIKSIITKYMQDPNATPDKIFKDIVK